MNCPRCQRQTNSVKAGRFCSHCGWLENQTPELIKQATQEIYMMAMDLHNEQIAKIDAMLEEIEND